MVCRSSDTPFSIQQYLLPDWDNFNKGIQVQHTISRVIRVKYAKSYQDYDTNTPKTLSLPARLKILANAGTQQAYTECPIFCQVFILPSTPVTLVLNSYLIVSNHLSSASLAYYTPVMSASLKKSTASQKKPFSKSIG